MKEIPIKNALQAMVDIINFFSLVEGTTYGAEKYVESFCKEHNVCPPVFDAKDKYVLNETRGVVNEKNL